MTSLGLSTFDQNWHHRYSASAGGKKSFQWCPDQSDRPKGAWDMHKNAQKVKRKTQTKISCHYTRLLHGKNCLSRWCFLRSFLTASKPSRRSITAAKRKEKKRRKRKGKKITKIEKPKNVGHFLDQKLSQNFDFCAHPSQHVLKCDASGKKGKLSCCKCLFDQIKANLADIQPSWKPPICKTKNNFGKKFQVSMG